MREWWLALWHRVLHWLGLNACCNFTEWRGERLWHVVVCRECGEDVLSFPSHITRTSPLF